MSRSTPWRAYARIAQELRRRITDGELAPGEKLASEAALCTEFAVTRNTVRRALAELEQEGLVDAVPGSRRVVRGRRSTGPEVEGHAVPQYRTIALDLRGAVERGDLVVGEKLPSEAALARRYGVSRGTVRQALADLEGAGLVEARQGKGRFVWRRP